MTSDPPLLEIDGVSKAFPGVLANDAIAFDLRAGEIHALIGENGAGKTTLMGILFGLHRPDAGRILVDGAPMASGDPHQAILHGIGFVQQHYSLIPTLSVMENLVLGSRYGALASVGRREIVARVEAMAARYGLSLERDATVERLSVGEQQHVELIKALIARPRILILDEPGALLSAEEAARLWSILRDLADSGVGVILIGHELEEVLAVADRVTVLRQGRVVATVAAADVDVAALGALMVGEIAATEHPGHAPAADPAAAETALVVRDVSVRGEPGTVAVRDVSLAVRRGEVLGIAGLAGSGQVTLIEALAGIRPIDSGHLLMHGEDIRDLGIRERQARGLAFVPADRGRDGLIGPLSLADNLSLGARASDRLAPGGLLRRRAIDRHARALIERFGIRAAGPGAPVATLSGGNQQKAILARELARDPEVILACYPTRGLDFAATKANHDELRRAAERGAAVLVVSIDLGELLGLAHRLVVMQGGRVTGEVETARVSAAEVGVMMGGGAAA